MLFENLLSEVECAELIEVAEYTPPTIPSLPFTDSPHQINPSEYIFRSKSLQLLISSRLPQRYIVDSDFVLTNWKIGCNLELHLDEPNDFDMQCFCYLNTVSPQNGGQFYFQDGSEILPIQGRAVIFNGKEVWHGVRKLTSGKRYVLLCFLKLDPKYSQHHLFCNRPPVDFLGDPSPANWTGLTSSGTF